MITSDESLFLNYRETWCLSQLLQGLYCHLLTNESTQSLTNLTCDSTYHSLPASSCFVILSLHPSRHSSQTFFSFLFSIVITTTIFILCFLVIFNNNKCYLFWLNINKTKNNFQNNELRYNLRKDKMVIVMVYQNFGKLNHSYVLL